MLLFIRWNISPEIFRIDGFALRYYSLAFMLAFLASYRIMAYMLDSEGKSRMILDRLLIYVVAGTIIGARLGHCLFYEFGYYRHHLLEIVLPFRWGSTGIEWTGYQGLASHGGAIGILVATGWFAHRYKLSWIWLLDRLAVVVPLAGGLVRIGNFFNAEIVGLPSQLPWAVIFERVDDIPRHPAQLYEAACYFIIFALLIFLYKKNKAARKPGYLFGLLLILVFSTRFLIEFVKENQEAFENGHLLNMGQLLSLPLIAAGFYFLCFYNRQHDKK
ncbi:prolipoprotein diacylglyceryl transferase [Chitinophaga flava]|nr:prolipoprotein diacylglyceryl transferase [Chitinophaga flava]